MVRRKPGATSSLGGERDSFLVCGLGSLGQHCVANLKTFGVCVSAVDLEAPHHWEVPRLPKLLHRMVIGDCRYEEVLEEAGVRDCRAVLLVTRDERVNLEAALTARVLNPSIRLVVRSDKQNLNDLLSLQLENFVAFEPTQLAAPAFALEAYGESLLGFFQVGGHRFQVVRHCIDRNHRWRDRRALHELENRNRRVLRHLPRDQTNLEETTEFSSASSQFYTWLPNTTVREGDELVIVETQRERESPASAGSSARRPNQIWRNFRHIRSWWDIQRLAIQFWRASYEQQIRRVALLCGLTVVGLCFLGTILLYVTSPEPEMGLQDAFYATVVLLLGGYGDLFSEIVPGVRYPELIRLFSLLLTLAGTAFIGVLYALLTEKLLTLRFEFLERRPPVPEQGHVVVIWLGRVGSQVVKFLQEFNQPVVGINPQTIAHEVLPEMPLIVGDGEAALGQVNLAQAKSVVAVSDDEVQNLEVGLLAHRVNPNCRLIIRTYDQQLTDKLARLFPYVQVMCASAISAEAFAGAAFGEHVLSIFRLYHQMVLVTEYTIELHDTLNGRLLSEVAYGYGVVPIWHQRRDGPSTVMPSEDLRLHPGDELVVLATIRGLRRIEQGRAVPQQWQVKVDKVFSSDARFDGANELTQICGFPIGEARAFMNQLPGLIPYKLYRHQALRLVRRLLRSQVRAQIIPPDDLF